MTVNSPSLHDNFTAQSPDGYEKRSFQSLLRKRDAEFKALQTENFELNMKIYYLERRLVDEAEPRRESAEPEADNFYDFNDGKPDPDAINKTTYDFQDNDPVVQALRKELNSLRAENTHLIEKNHQLTDTVDDLRDKNIADLEAAEEKLSGLHSQVQALTNQSEDLQSEKMTLEIEIAQSQESMQIALKDGEHGKQRENAALAKCEGFRIQLEATTKALRKADDEKQNALRVLSKKTTQVIASDAELQKLRIFAKQAQAENVKGANELREASALITKLKHERNTAIKRFELERESGKVWTDTEKQLQEGSLLLSGDDSALESLLNLIHNQQKAYEGRTKYDPKWQEIIINDMNDCLRALYCSQREVEAKRQQFVDRFYLPSGGAPSLTNPQTKATAPVS